MPSQIHAVIITVSDAGFRGERKDESGEALVQLLEELGAEIVATRILSDDLDPLTDALREFADWRHVNLIVTTGGTGFSPRANTPEATLAVIVRQTPALPASLRLVIPTHNPMAMI